MSLIDRELEQALKSVEKTWNLSLPAERWQESEQAYELELEIGSFKRREVQLQVDGGVLSVEARQERKDRNWFASQAYAELGYYHNLIALPADVDTEHISARMRGKRVYVRLPKVPRQVKSIPIQGATPAAHRLRKKSIWSKMKAWLKA
ncbi:MAG: Hsp20 family protein [Cytophagales bacterium]|nr:Hsp20 family protein [Cytophagales bacterium]